jgi:cation diffusion facilitator CzcD-associated flavoprotein CzcO
MFTCFNRPGVWYSLSFRQKPDWSQLYPSGDEIYKYIQEAAIAYDLPSRTQLNTEVLKCEWNETSKEWIVTIRRLVPGMGDLTNAQIRARIQDEGEAAAYVGGEEQLRCKVLISAVGALEQPRDIPTNIPGLGSFKGRIIQSARWPDDATHELRDKSVLVVGAGCSAAQLVPALLQPNINVGKITQLMREPHWVVERTTLPISDAQRITLSKYVPGFMALLRWITYFVTEFDYQALGDSWWARTNRSWATWASKAFLERTAPGKVSLQVFYRE